MIFTAWVIEPVNARLKITECFVVTKGRLMVKMGTYNQEYLFKACQIGPSRLR